MEQAKLHPLMRVAFDAARSAEKAGASVWDALASFAGTEERATHSAQGLKRAVQAQIEAYGSTLSEPDWSPNSNSTWRVYRRLIVQAREFGVPVVTADDDGAIVARSVADVRKDVQAAKDAAKPEDEAEGKGEGGGDGAEFDALPPDERITAALGFIRKAYGELPTLEARQAARTAVRELLDSM